MASVAADDFVLTSAKGVVQYGERFTADHHMGKRHRLTISLTAPDYDALTVYAGAQERSLSWVIAQAVRQFLLSERPPERVPYAVSEPTSEQRRRSTRRRK